MNITKLILIAFGIATFGVVSFYALKSFNRYTDVLAVHDCAQDYKQEIVVSETTKKIRPLEQETHDCAYQKGVKNWTGIWTDLVK